MASCCLPSHALRTGNPHHAAHHNPETPPRRYVALYQDDPDTRIQPLVLCQAWVYLHLEGSPDAEGGAAGATAVTGTSLGSVVGSRGTVTGWAGLGFVGSKLGSASGKGASAFGATASAAGGARKVGGVNGREWWAVRNG